MKTAAPPPNPPTTRPMAVPFRCGNHFIAVVMVGMSAMFWPKAETNPYVAATIHNSLDSVKYVRAQPELKKNL